MKTTTEARRHREGKGGEITMGKIPHTPEENDTNQRIARVIREIRDYDKEAWKVSLLAYGLID